MTVETPEPHARPAGRPPCLLPWSQQRLPSEGTKRGTETSGSKPERRVHTCVSVTQTGSNLVGDLHLSKAAHATWLLRSLPTVILGSSFCLLSYSPHPPPNQTTALRETLSKLHLNPGSSPLTSSPTGPVVEGHTALDRQRGEKLNVSCASLVAWHLGTQFCGAKHCCEGTSEKQNHK